MKEQEEHWIVKEEKRLRKEKENPVTNVTPFKELTEAQDKAREEFLKRHHIEREKEKEKSAAQHLTEQLTILQTAPINSIEYRKAIQVIVQLQKELGLTTQELFQPPYTKNVRTERQIQVEYPELHYKEQHNEQPIEQHQEQHKELSKGEYGKHEARASTEIFTEGNFILAEYGKDRYIVENTISSHCAIFTRYKSAKSAIRLINTNKVPTTGGEDFLQCLGWLSNEPDYVKRIYRKKVTDYPGSRFNLNEFETGYLPACIDCDKPNTGSYEPDTGDRDDLKYTGDRTPEL